jgi:alpha-D-ribose 1-methylphosphonate 5-triphosphate diphosphatase
MTWKGVHTQMDLVIHNANVVTPTGVIENRSIGIEDGIIVRIVEGDMPRNGNSVDACGYYVLPGFIDMHSDAIEKEIEPRPGAVFPIEVALFELDKRLASCGVTTIYHSISFAERGIGTRTNKRASEIAWKITDLAQSMKVHTKIHARYEITDIDAFPFLEALAREGKLDLLSVMDHTPGQGQFKEMLTFKNYYGRVHGQNEEELERLIARKINAKKMHGDDGLKAVIALCRKSSIPLASHDDDTPEKIQWLQGQGITISEFPVTYEAVRAAARQGLVVCFGAPNILRGGSQTGNLSARQAIAEGYGNIICSDYSPMSMLHAVMALMRCGLKPLHESVNMTSLNPAKALGISGRTGSVEEGKVADLVVVNASREVPLVMKTFVSGKEVYSTC